MSNCNVLPRTARFHNVALLSDLLIFYMIYELWYSGRFKVMTHAHGSPVCSLYSWKCKQISLCKTAAKLIKRWGGHHVPRPPPTTYTVTLPSLSWYHLDRLTDQCSHFILLNNYSFSNYWIQMLISISLPAQSPAAVPLQPTLRY